MFASEVSLKSDLRGKEGHFLLPPKSASSVIPTISIFLLCVHKYFSILSLFCVPFSYYKTQYVNYVKCIIMVMINLYYLGKHNLKVRLRWFGANLLKL